MIEIEIKVQVSEHDIYQIRSFLLHNATFVNKSSQSDEYFTPCHRNFLSPAYPFEWLSIRERDTDIILNYKHWYPEGEKESTHCNEYEVKLSSYNDISLIFKALNIISLCKVSKEREVFNYNDDFEISLDKVDELGWFIEIEVINDIWTIEDANQKLLDFSNQIGLDTTNRNYRGYPYLLLEKKGLIK